MSVGNRIAVFEGPALLFVGANEAWYAAWERRNAMPPPQPGVPYAELFPGRWRELYALAREAQRERVVTEGAMVNADGDLGIERFIPVGDRAVAAHWTPNAAPARVRDGGCGTALPTRRSYRVSRPRRAAGPS